MANVGVDILSLPTTVGGLSGEEWMVLVQGGTTKRTQTSQFIDDGGDSQTPWLSNIDADGFNLLFDDGTGLLSSETGNPELLIFQSVASALNYFTVTNSATGDPPQLSATGDDTNIGMKFVAKGTGDGTAFTFDMGAGDYNTFLIEDAGTTDGGPWFALRHNSSSPAVGDQINIAFSGKDSAGNNQNWITFTSFILDPTSGSEDAYMTFLATVGGSQLDVFRGSDGLALGAANRFPGIGSMSIADGKGIFDQSNPPNEQLIFQTTASAVNYFEITNAATTTYPILSAAGDDTNIGLRFSVKGDPAMSLTAYPMRFDLGSSSQASPVFIGTSAGILGPGITILHDSATPAAGDYVGAFEMWGDDSGGTPSQVASAWSQWIDPTAASEDGKLILYTTIGALTYQAQMLLYDGIYIPGAGADGNPTAWPGQGNIGFADGKGFTDVNGNESLIFQTTASAVNYLEITNAATGTRPQISAVGSDTNVGLQFTNQGSPSYTIGTGSLNGVSAVFDISANSSGVFALRTTSTGTGGGAVYFYLDSASPAAGDFPGFISCFANDSGGTVRQFGGIQNRVIDHTALTMDSRWNFLTQVGGSNNFQLFIAAGVAICGDGFTSPTVWPGEGNLGISDGKGISDFDGNEQLFFQATASAVNYLEITNAATGTSPTISAVGSDANVGLIFSVQAAANPAVTFNLGTAPVVNFESPATGGVGPSFQLYHNSASPAAGDFTGSFEFYGEDAGGNKELYSAMYARLTDTTEGSEDGRLLFYLTVAGANSQVVGIGDGVVMGSGTTYPGSGNLSFADAKGIFDGAGNEQLLFQQTASAVNHLEIFNAAVDTNAIIMAGGSSGGITLQSPNDFYDIRLDFVNCSDAHFYITSQNAGTAGPYVTMHHDSASPAANDNISAWSFSGEDTASVRTSYAQMFIDILDPTNASEDGRLYFKTIVAGTNATRISVADGVNVGPTAQSPGSGILNAETNLQVAGTNVALQGKQSIWMPAGSMTPRLTSGAALLAREINSITVPSLGFDQTTDEGANFNIAFPKSWDAGTITYQVFWTCTGGGAAETVEFELRGGCFANDAAINATGYGTAVAVSDTWLADDDVMISAESSAVTLANAADDTLAFFEIIRDVSDDTLTADAELIGIKFFYTTNAGNDV